MPPARGQEPVPPRKEHRPRSSRGLPRYSRRAKLLGAAAVGAALCGGVGSWFYFQWLHGSARAGRGRSQAEQSLTIAGADAGYVDTTACAPCHAGIWESYKKTGMGRSFSAVMGEGQPTSGSYYHEASDRHYTIALRDGKLYQRRNQVGFGGKESNIIEKTMDYA